MAENNRVLIVDDDLELVDMLREYLVTEEFHVDSAHTYISGLATASSGKYDLVILDIMLPDGSGLELLRKLRAESSVPVMLLSAAGNSEDRVSGLDIGADDFVPKPFEPQELIARVRAILRRVRCPDGHGGTGDWVTAGDLAVSPSLRAATFRNKELDLTSVEFNVLECLMRHRGSVVPREQLVRLALGREPGMLDRSLDVHISHLRRKLLDSGATDIRIKAVRGNGYLYAESMHEVAASRADDRLIRINQQRFVGGV